ncbi:hypothetical protein Tco_0316823 [Tanacetum coccineum]
MCNDKSRFLWQTTNGVGYRIKCFYDGRRQGMGLRTLEDLLKGTFVCEHVGDIVTNTKLLERMEQNIDGAELD